MAITYAVVQCYTDVSVELSALKQDVITAHRMGHSSAVYPTDSSAEMSVSSSNDTGQQSNSPGTFNVNDNSDRENFRLMVTT